MKGNAQGKSKVFISANWGMLVIFLLGVVVQYNDPDPIRWMMIYGLAAVACLLAIRGQSYGLLAALVGVTALVWAGWLIPHVIGHVSFGDLFESIRMKNTVVEEGREMGGLLIIASWMAVLTLSGFWRSRRT